MDVQQEDSAARDMVRAYYSICNERNEICSFLHQASTSREDPMRTMVGYIIYLGVLYTLA